VARLTILAVDTLGQVVSGWAVAGSLIAAIVSAVVTGRLIPRSWVKEQLNRVDAELKRVAADRDEWRETSRLNEQTLLTTATQLGEVLRVVNVINAAVLPPPPPKHVRRSDQGAA